MSSGVYDLASVRRLHAIIERRLAIVESDDGRWSRATKALAIGHLCADVDASCDDEAWRAMLDAVERLATTVLAELAQRGEIMSHLF